MSPKLISSEQLNLVRKIEFRRTCFWLLVCKTNEEEGEEEDAKNGENELFDLLRQPKRRRINRIPYLCEYDVSCVHVHVSVFV